MRKLRLREAHPGHAFRSSKSQPHTPLPTHWGKTTKSTPEPQVSALLSSHTEGHGSCLLPSELSFPPWGQGRSLTPSTTTQSLGSGLGGPLGIAVLCPQDPARLPSTWLLSHLSPAVSSHSVDVPPVLPTSRPTPGRVSRALAHMCPPPGLWADAPLPALLSHPLCCVPFMGLSLLAPLRETPLV